MAKRKSPKPYKALRQPEFEYIASLIEDGGDNETNASIARRTGRSETTIARIRAAKTWDVYNGSDKTKAPRKSSPAKSTTNGPVAHDWEKGQLAGLHKHVGRLEGKINEVVQYLDRQDARGKVVQRDLEPLTEALTDMLDVTRKDVKMARKTLATVHLISWLLFLMVAIILFILVKVIYVS